MDRELKTKVAKIRWRDLKIIDISHNQFSDENHNFLLFRSIPLITKVLQYDIGEPLSLCYLAEPEENVSDACVCNHFYINKDMSVIIWLIYYS